MLGIALALSSSLVWGAADFLAGLANRRAPLLTVLFGSQLAGLGVVSVVLWIRGVPLPWDARLGYAVLGATGSVIGLSALYRGLARGPMGIVAPVSALSGAVPVFVGLLLGERPSQLQLIGTALSLLGVAAVATTRSQETGHQRAWIAVALGLLAAAGLGSVLVGLSAASAADPLWAVFALRLSVVVLLAGMLAGRALVVQRVDERPARASRASARDDRGQAGAPSPQMHVPRLTSAQIASAGVLDVSANLMYGIASNLGALSIVGLLGSLYPVSTVLLAWFLLRERLRPVQIAGVATVLTGVAAISLG